MLRSEWLVSLVTHFPSPCLVALFALCTYAHISPVKRFEVTNCFRWHADIKLDNILLVHGGFKLADFGFAKFAETENQAKPPEQLVVGGTDTFGIYADNTCAEIASANV